jgi:hypothetical protein
MSSNTTGAAAHGLRADGLLVDKRIMFLILAFVLCGVWAYARFGGPEVSPVAPSTGPVVGHFAAPIAFVATPGLNLAHIHVRSGPGADFKIQETLPRGEPLTGVARTADTSGAFWIELANGRGYVKESVLTPADGQSPP